MRLLTVTCAGPGTSAPADSLAVTFAGAGAFVAARAVVRRTCGRADLAARVAGRAFVGAAVIAADGGVAGAGISGSVFVLFCAMALDASIAPKTNQQFVFMIPKVKS